MLATYTVNTDVDEFDFVGDMSLREAIFLATSPGDIVDFDPNEVNGATIELDDSLGEIAIFDVDESLTIDASMLSQRITIQAAADSRIFNITDATSGDDPPEVTMIGMTLTGGDVSGDGGAIRSEAMLTLQDMEIVGNEAGHGGGVYLAVAAGGSSGNRDVLTIENSKIENNSAAGDGGGVYVLLNSTSGDATQSVQITDSMLTGNTAGSPSFGGRGGALYVNRYSSAAPGTRNAIVITSSQLESNTAFGTGGAIYHRGTRVDLSIEEESTVSGNEALTGRGGGIYSYAHAAHLKIENSTISGNHADHVGVGDGGGVFARLRDSASLYIADSEISGNTAGVDGGGVHARAHEDFFGSPFPAQRAITITRSLISGNNEALRRGGGLYTWNENGTETLIEDSRITGNHVPDDISTNERNGGGIYAYLHGYTNVALKPRFIITGSTIDNNTTEKEGGGIFVCSKAFGHFVATNTTVSGNETLDTTEGRGGGIVIARTTGEERTIDADLRNVTITQNVSVDGGGIHSADLDGVRVRIANTIISENFDLPVEDTNRVANNLVGRVVDEVFKHNLVGTSAIEDENGNSPTLDNTNILDEDEPGLDPLAMNGGLTPTHALRFGSPAIDQGADDLASDPLTPFTDFATDQRGTGFDRIYDFPGIDNGGAGSVDIGAYELTQLCVSTTVDEFDTDVSFGDLDITDSLTIRGIGTATSVAWKPGVIDRLFELVGDYNGDGEVDAADYTVWSDTKFSTPDPGAVTADGDDDGDIDNDDETNRETYFGNTFLLDDVDEIPPS